MEIGGQEDAAPGDARRFLRLIHRFADARLTCRAAPLRGALLPGRRLSLRTSGANPRRPP